MGSVVYFKFKNAVQQHQVTFDGAVIQIGDVKRLVAQKQGLGPEGAAELTLYDPNTGDEYSDDGKVIPRNTLVIVKRAPATKLKPLTSTAGTSAPIVATLQQQPVAQPPQQPGNVAPSTTQNNNNTADDDFGGDAFAAPAVNQQEEDALRSRLQHDAMGWKREVMQASHRGRGRGRGGAASVPLDYKCARCDAVGVHLYKDCPHLGDPAYDRKRVRPPVGIPMTRLKYSEEGGLVLPGGTTGTLLANESAFAREILGILPGVALPPVTSTANNNTGGGGGVKKEEEDAKPVLALDNKPAVDQYPGQFYSPGEGSAAPKLQISLNNHNNNQQQQFMPSAVAPPSIVIPSIKPTGGGSGVGPSSVVPPPPPAAPRLVGEDDLGAAGGPDFHDATFFQNFLKSSVAPRGPPDFIKQAYQGKEPLSRSEFERVQDEYRSRYNMQPLKRRHRSRSRSKSRERSSSRRDKEKEKDRRRERSRSGERSHHNKRDREHSHSRDEKTDKERKRERSRSVDAKKEKSSKRDKEKKEKKKHDDGDRDSKRVKRSSSGEVAGSE